MHNFNFDSAALNNGSSPIDMGELDPVVLSLAELVGVLVPVEGQTDSYNLNDDWFAQPLKETSDNIKNNGAQLADLLAQLLGEVGGHALGIPVTDPGLLGTWYPFNKPGTQDPTGFYIITYKAKDNEGKESQVFGLGVMHTWTVSLNDKELAAAAGPKKILVRAWGMLPVLAVGNGEFKLVVGQAKFPLYMGIEVEAQDEPLVSFSGFSFTGVKFTANIDVQASNPLELSIVVLQLQLPDEDTPSNRSLADLANISGGELLSTAASLFISALSNLIKQPELTARAKFLLPVLGLSPKVPLEQFSSVRLPLLGWEQFLELAKRGENLAEPFINWFTQLLSTPSYLQAWFSSIGGLMGIKAPTISGDGSRANPYLVPLISDTGVGQLSLSAASSVDKDGVRHFFPGLEFDGKGISIGSSPTEIKVTAALELAEFNLAPGGSVSYTGPSSLNFQAGFDWVNKTEGQPLFSGSIGGLEYSFGSLHGGLELGGDLRVIPSFALMSVQTPSGNYESLDLTQPGELVDKAKQELYADIDVAFRKLFGLDGKIPFGGYVAALLGFIPPTLLPNGVTWPSDELPPPFSAAQIANSIQNPIAALGSYYASLLQNNVTVGGKVPFFYMLSEMAALLQMQQGGVLPAVQVTGEGTVAAPWQATLTQLSLPASLTAYVESIAGDADTIRLVLGIALNPQVVTQGGTTVALSFNLNFLSLDLPKSNPLLPVKGNLMPNLAVSLTLPGGFTTPAVLGGQLQVSSAGFSARWSRFDSWHWSMQATQPKLIIDQTVLPIGEDLNFSDGQSLRDLVLKEAQTFAPILVGVLGIAVSRSGARAGLAMTGILGLLPDLTAFMPAGLTWPATMPTLKLTDFSNPVAAIRTQLAGIFSGADNARAALTLLGWALGATDSPVPTLIGTGTFQDPFRVSFPAQPSFNLPVWFESQTPSFGTGLGRTTVTALGSQLQASTDIRLNAVNVSLNGGTPPSQNQVPSFSLISTFTNPNGVIVELPDGQGSLVAAALGFTLSFAGGAFNLTPVVTLSTAESQGEGAVTQRTLDDLTNASPSVAEAFYSLLNLAVQAIVQSSTDNSTFKTLYGLLADMGLMLEVKQAGDPAGINPAGWRALQANPLNFSTQAVLDILSDQTRRDLFLNLVKKILGINWPDIPTPVLNLLAALDIVETADLGYAVKPDTVIQLASHPVRTLTSKFEALITDQDRLAALVSSLKKSNLSVDFGIFTFDAIEGTKLRLSIKPEKAYRVGTLLQVSGAVSFDLQSATLSGALRLYNSSINFALVPQLDYAIGGGASALNFTVRLQWGDGVMPAPAPLQIYPFKSQDFINSLADLAPAYALSTFVTGVIENQLLKDYALARAVFLALGIAGQDANNNWRMKSPLGLLEHPLDWLLSDAVMGADGRLNLPQLQKVLKTLPDVKASNGIAVSQVENGIRLSGLPYNVFIDVLVDLTAKVAEFNAGLSTPVPLGGGHASVDKLNLGLSLGSNFQPGISGLISVSGNVGLTQPIFVEGGYDYHQGFLLSVGERGANNPTLQLLPFAGWNSLIQAAVTVAVQELLQTLTSALLDALTKQGAGDFAQRLRTAADKDHLNIPQLVESILAAQPDLKKMEQAALNWLVDRVSATNVNQTMQAINTLFSGLIDGLTASNGLIRYTPGKTLPLTLLLGSQTINGAQQLGLWVELDLPETSIIQVSINQTGISVPLSDLTAPVFYFGLELTVPIEGSLGPQLSFAYDAAEKGFNLSFDPLGNDSYLKEELYPTLFGQTDSTKLKQAIEQWLLNVMIDVLPRYISIVVLNSSIVKQWLDSPIVTNGPKPGPILVASQLLINPDNQYQLNSFQALKSLTVESFLAKFLKALMATEIPLFVISGPNNSIRIGIWIGPSESGASNYGIRLIAQDLTVINTAKLVVKLQLGGADSDWITKAGGTAPAGNGLSVYIPITNDRPVFENLQLNLINVGMDFDGANSTPLVNMQRFRLDAVAPRALLSLAFNNLSPTVKFGACLTLEQIGISLTPNTATPSNNPVAQNLLGSGESGQDKNQNNPPSNPSFSVRAAYVEHLYVELFSDTGSSQTQIWVPVQRSFGPVHANKIGVGWEQKDKLAEVLFDGDVTLAGLAVSLIGLSIGIPVTSLTDYRKYQLDLAGLDISYQGGGVVITGGLLKTVTDEGLSYTGLALMKAATFSLFAVGAYAEVKVNPTDPNSKSAPSLFIFANLNTPLGGPPAFFITGLAAGFSYNRNILLPSVSEIQDFPLVQGAMNPAYFAGADASKALEKIADIVKPEIGQYWVAAGIKFTSFELLTSFAVLFVKFGREFEIDLIGLSVLSLPTTPGSSPDNAVALLYVELGLIASFKPDEGVISVFAQLTPNSFLLYKDCKLTGGFAFVLWYKGDHAGDFVITLGGYNPAFDKPKHYPDVPRLGFNWPVESPVGNVSISGGAYFALTPSAVMAGGYLKVVYEWGPLRAWLNAGADFLIAWKPFYYIISVSVSVGVAFQTTILGVSVTLSVELGASLDLFGPPTAGKAHISWYVISFTISFGATDQNSSDTKPLKWESFVKNFLPPPSSNTQDHSVRAELGAPVEPIQQVVKLRVESGLLQSAKSYGWLVQPVPFVLVAESAMPSSQISIPSSGTSVYPGVPLGIRPMDVTTVDTPMSVTVNAIDPKTHKATPVTLPTGITITTMKNGSPDALWAKTPLDPEAPPTAEMTPGALFGLRISATDYQYLDQIGPMDLRKAFGPETLGPLNLPYDFTPQYPPAPPIPQVTPIATIMATIMSSAVILKRNPILQSLTDSGLTSIPNPNLYVMQSSANVILQSPPLLAHLGLDLADKSATGEMVTTAAAAAPATEPDVQAASPLTAHLLGGIRRYRQATLHAPLNNALTMFQQTGTSGRWVDARTGRQGESAAQRFLIPNRDGTDDDTGIRKATSHRMRLFSGSTLLWELSGASGTARIQAEGDLPLRIICFNRYDELIADLHDVAPTSGFALPQGTAQIAVHGLSALGAAKGNTVGWHADTSLLKVNHYYMMGDGFAVRPQAALRVRRKGRFFRRGLVDARTMLKENEVQAGDGRTLPGWVQTVVSSRMNSFAVILENKVDDENTAALGMRVCASYEETPEAARYDKPLRPTRIQQSEEGTVLFYQMPTDDSTASKKYLCILTQALEESAKPVGVYAMSVEASNAEMQNLSIESHGVDLKEIKVPSTVLTLTVENT